MRLPKLKILARELQTIEDGQDRDLTELINHVLDDDYPRKELISELMDNDLSFFAGKVASRYYDNLPKKG